MKTSCLLLLGGIIICSCTPQPGFVPVLSDHIIVSAKMDQDYDMTCEVKNIEVDSGLRLMIGSGSQENTKGSLLESVPQSFSIFGYYFSGTIQSCNYLYNDLMTYDSGSGQWTSSSAVAPVPPSNKTFFWAVNRNPQGVTFPARDYSGTPYFNYTCPSDILQQQDLILAKVSSSNGMPSNLSFSFSHILSSVDISIGALASNVSLKSVKFKNICTSAVYSLDTGWGQLSGVSDRTLTLNQTLTKASEGTSLTSSGKTFFLIPGSFQGSSRLEVVYNAGNGEKTASFQLPLLQLLPGKRNVLTLSFSEDDPVIDPSKRDPVTGNSIAQTTANCYLLTSTGEYKIPLVYGNAITDGQVNTASYTSSATGSNVLGGFLNCDGNAISSPYIETDLGRNATGALVLWSDTQNLISDLSFLSGSPCRMLQFKVNSNEGNAIVGIKDTNGVLWSWHIWVYPSEPSTDIIVQSETVSYEVLSVPIGFCPTRLTATYYQWGRKDPIMSPSVTLYGSSLRSTKTVQTTIPQSIKNPNVMYCTSTTWLNPVYYNLWDSDNSSLHVDSGVVKTIYDPSPVGFNVPSYQTFAVYMNSDWYMGIDGKIMRLKRNEEDMEGMNIYLLSQLDATNGSWTDTPSASFWLSSPYNATKACYFKTLNASRQPHVNQSMSVGAMIICKRE